MNFVMLNKEYKYCNNFGSLDFDISFRPQSPLYCRALKDPNFDILVEKYGHTDDEQLSPISLGALTRIENSLNIA